MLKKVLTAAVLLLAPTDAAETYEEALDKIDFNEVKQALRERFVKSEDFYPADYGNYGPFFIRLAWHCSGSYRISDGRGGCGGGRQRFEPERSWADNTNLDKARALLAPIKMKYGMGLSWGDLFILAGTTAIESMGGPVLGFCAGRVDQDDGAWSDRLGPSDEQEKWAPCETNGTCVSPLGSTTVGLIYVNPAGPMGVPDPEGSVNDVRDSFRRMAMNDSETVALIGGGHAFGKTHGACLNGTGPSPKEDPVNPWPRLCDNGTFTSGFEGSWTPNPTQWDNEYFKELVTYNWTVADGPGGNPQWSIADGSAEDLDVMMLTSDISLTKDPSFLQWTHTFAEDKAALEHAFMHAWYKLTTRDMGPHSRCRGNLVPEAQPFQYPLPPIPTQMADFNAVRADIKTALTTNSTELPADDAASGAYYGAWFVHLAYQCAATFRRTDKLGGCNGARIRYATNHTTWPENRDLDGALRLLERIQSKYAGLSWADLIVFAGQVAMEEAGGPSISFCPGRTDTPEDDMGWEYLVPPQSYPPQVTVMDRVRDHAHILGLSSFEYTALAGRPRGLRQQQAVGRAGSWTHDPSRFSNEFFTTLLDNLWEEVLDSDSSGSGDAEYKAKGKDLYMRESDLVFKYDPELLSISQGFAFDNNAYSEAFASAWAKLMNLDRFDGPTGNVCQSNTPGEDPGSSGKTKGWQIALACGGGVLVGALVAVGGVICFRKRSEQDDYNPM